jgi:hypothetical protein
VFTAPGLVVNERKMGKSLAFGLIELPGDQWGITTTITVIGWAGKFIRLSCGIKVLA